MNKPQIVPPTLSVEERRLVQLYRTMDLYSHQVIMDFAIRLANRWPMHPEQPAAKPGIRLATVAGERVPATLARMGGVA